MVLPDLFNLIYPLAEVVRYPGLLNLQPELVASQLQISLSQSSVQLQQELVGVVVDIAMFLPFAGIVQ